MKCDAFHRVVCGAVSALTLTLVVTCAVAQTSAISNVELCNGRDHSSAEPQICGCSALIKSDADNPKVLAIAYNNRGNAFSKEGQYELAIQDYDKSINLDPGYAKPLNNRGVAYQKQGDLDRAIQDFNAAINIDPNYADAFFNRGATYLKRGTMTLPRKILTRQFVFNPRYEPDGVTGAGPALKPATYREHWLIAIKQFNWSRMSPPPLIPAALLTSN